MIGRWIMRLGIWIALGWVFSLGTAWAQDNNQAPSPTPTASAKSFSPDHLKGTTGFGITSFNYTGSALAYRYWTSDSTALDIYLGGNYSQTNSYDFSGNSTVVPNWNYGLGAALKQNWNEPVKNVFIQSLERLTYSQNYNQSISTTSNSGTLYGYEYYYNQNQALGLYLGLGFEAFIPFWENLSIEGTIGVSATASWSETNTFYNSNFSSNTNTHTSAFIFNFGSGSNTFSILNGAVHLYF